MMLKCHLIITVQLICFTNKMFTFTWKFVTQYSMHLIMIAMEAMKIINNYNSGMLIAVIGSLNSEFKVINEMIVHDTAEILKLMNDMEWK